MRVGNAIRSRRRELGIGPTDFAQQLHVSVKTTERWERGETDGALKQLDEIAAALKTTPQLLTMGAADQPQPTGDRLDRIEALLAEVLERLPERESTIGSPVERLVTGRVKERRAEKPGNGKKRKGA